MSQFSILFILVAISHTVDGQCLSQCSIVKSQTSVNPCQLCFNNCESKFSLTSCYGMYQDCSVVIKGGCQKKKNTFSVETQCLQNCCSSLPTQECLSKYAVVTQEGNPIWVWIIIGVVPVLLVIAVFICYRCKKNTQAQQQEQSEVNNGTIQSQMQVDNQFNKNQIQSLNPSWDQPCHLQGQKSQKLGSNN